MPPKTAFHQDLGGRLGYTTKSGKTPDPQWEFMADGTPFFELRSIEPGGEIPVWQEPLIGIDHLFHFSPADQFLAKPPPGFEVAVATPRAEEGWESNGESGI